MIRWWHLVMLPRWCLAHPSNRRRLRKNALLAVQWHLGSNSPCNHTIRKCAVIEISKKMALSCWNLTWRVWDWVWVKLQPRIDRQMKRHNPIVLFQLRLASMAIKDNQMLTWVRICTSKVWCLSVFLVSVDPSRPICTRVRTVWAPCTAGDRSA